MATPVVLDCDLTLGRHGEEPGDAIALAVLLGSPEVDLAGITTTFGRAPIDAVYRDTRRAARLLGKEEIPVFRGAPWPGHRPTEAAHFLSELARRRPGAIVVVSTGPLSNLVAAEELRRGFLTDLGRVVCSGGTDGRGSRGREGGNLALDPAAARAVLCARRPVTVMSGELRELALLSCGHLRQTRAWPAAVRSRLRRWMLGRLLAPGWPRVSLRDALPALYAARPGLFEERTVIVSTAPEDLARGLLRRLEGESGAVANVPVAVRDALKLRALALSALERLASSAALG